MTIKLNPELLKKFAEVSGQQASESEKPKVVSKEEEKKEEKRKIKVGNKWIIPTNEQEQAIKYFEEGQAFVLKGKAGTGKTTTAVAGILSLAESGKIGKLEEDHKTLKEDNLAIAIISYTNKAVENLRRQLPENLKECCLTAHKLLEYHPEVTTVMNENGDLIDKRVWVYGRNAHFPIFNLQYVIIEEASMMDEELFKKVEEACPNATFIFLGDLNQLKPVFGDSILEKKQHELPVVNLTIIQRQALESPIIRFLSNILEGHTISSSYLQDFTATYGQGKFRVKFWPKKNILPELLLKVFKEQIVPGLVEAGAYNPEEDMILVPHNVGFGSIEINKIVGQYVKEKEDKEVYEIIAGWQRHYLCIGDRVMWKKQDGRIIKIEENPKYFGQATFAPSKKLNRWGEMEGEDLGEFDLGVLAARDAEEVIINLGNREETEEEKTNAASHTITIQLEGSGDVVTVSTAGEVNELILGYALTVHKAQGSEWNRVILMLHGSHMRGPLVSRELIYTAASRAKEELFIFCEEDNLEKACKRVRVKSNV